MKKVKEKAHGKGLRRLWVKNTAIVVVAVGLVLVLAITAFLTAYYYAAAESDLRSRAHEATVQVADNLNYDYSEFYRSCLTYTQMFDDSSSIELLFVDVNGEIVASSFGGWVGKSVESEDIRDARSTRGICSYVGKSALAEKRIMAVSSPIIHSSGDVIGVLRFMMPTQKMDMQIASVAGISVGVVLFVGLVILFCVSQYMQSVLVPLEEIIEKSQKIANGSYGIQIQTKYDDEIGDLARTINELSLKISQNEKMQKEFISSLSHELRTPLTAITGWSETLLSSEKLDYDTRRGVRIIHRESDRLTEMVVDLLDFTRIQDDRLTLNMETVDIRKEFEDTVFMYGNRLAEEGIRLRYADNDQEIPEISCDPQRLRQVFLNILNNAVKHGGEGKMIDASIVFENDFVVVYIRDYGPGIPEDELALVKKKFYKGSSKARGSGIGLAVSDEIVQKHGGELILTNATSGGTLVTVRLPAAQ